MDAMLRAHRLGDVKGSVLRRKATSARAEPLSRGAGDSSADPGKADDDSGKVRGVPEERTDKYWRRQWRCVHHLSFAFPPFTQGPKVNSLVYFIILRVDWASREMLMHQVDDHHLERAGSAADAHVLRRKGHLKEQDDFIDFVVCLKRQDLYLSSSCSLRCCSAGELTMETEGWTVRRSSCTRRTRLRKRWRRWSAGWRSTGNGRSRAL